MKRGLLLILVGVISLTAVLLGLHQYLTILAARPVAQSGLMRTANSAYKYQLCTEAYAFAHAAADNPYKTDYTFRDPFRAVDDTIVPRLLDYDLHSQTVTLTVDVIVQNVATFHTAIAQVHNLDGISILLPDKQNHLHSSNIPQFVIASLSQGKVAVLDYTCPNQWTWKAGHAAVG